MFFTHKGGGMKTLLIAVGLISLLSTPSFAGRDDLMPKSRFSQSGRFADLDREETRYSHRAGTWAITLSSDADIDVMGFSTSVGYYVADQLSTTVGAAFGKSEIDIAGVTEKTSELWFRLGLEYEFPTGSTVAPFIGSFVEYGSLEEDDGVTVTKVSLPVYGLSGGIKQMVGTHGSVNLRFEYATGPDEITVNGVKTDSDMTSFSGSLGYSIYFR
jgi:hypothetical protein